ncbi:MAG: glycosyltransferase family 2 protein, partial [Lachnospiraceae bacterium]|nr:glycosyltransferase family 2 protein [Lachnospiraceae bacterium]
MPLVSVCIPVYNNADTIIETIESIMNQTYSNIEILIADDRSKDNSYEVINDYI